MPPHLDKSAKGSEVRMAWHGLGLHPVRRTLSISTPRATYRDIEHMIAGIGSLCKGAFHCMELSAQ